MNGACISKLGLDWANEQIEVYRLRAIANKRRWDDSMFGMKQKVKGWFGLKSIGLRQSSENIEKGIR